MSQATGWKTRERGEGWRGSVIADIDCRVQYRWTYSPGSRCRVEDDARWQTESRTISARDIRSRGAYIRISSGFRARTAGQPPWRPIEMEFDRALRASSRFLLLPLACPLLSISLSGRTAAAAIKRQRQVPEWRSAADAQCDPLPPLECNRNEHASNPWTFDEARAFLFPRFIYLFALRIFAIPLYPTVCPRNFFVVRIIVVGRDVIGEVGSFQRIIKNFEKYLCRSCFDEKRAIIPRIYSLSRPRVYTPFSSSTIKFRIFLFKFSLSRNIDIWLVPTHMMKS